ncbi:hypothetical protein ES703_33877 [subsurface metagenome]
MAKLMSHSEAEELTQAKKLIDECKLDKADQLIKNFEEKGGHTLHDIVLCHLLNCELLYWRSLYKDVVKLAEQTYKESLGLGKNLLSVDALYYITRTLISSRNLEKAEEIIKQGEELLKTLTHELPKDYKQREAYIELLKGLFYNPIYIDKGDPDLALEQLNEINYYKKILENKVINKRVEVNYSNLKRVFNNNFIMLYFLLISSFEMPF